MKQNLKAGGPLHVSSTTIIKLGWLCKVTFNSVMSEAWLIHNNDMAYWRGEEGWKQVENSKIV